MDIRRYLKSLRERRNLKALWHSFAFCVLFIPYLLIDSYRVATEETQWERMGER